MSANTILSQGPVRGPLDALVQALIVASMPNLRFTILVWLGGGWAVGGNENNANSAQWGLMGYPKAVYQISDASTACSRLGTVHF